MGPPEQSLVFSCVHRFLMLSQKGLLSNIEAIYARCKPMPIRVQRLPAGYRLDPLALFLRQLQVDTPMTCLPLHSRLRRRRLWVS